MKSRTITLYLVKGDLERHEDALREAERSWEMWPGVRVEALELPSGVSSSRLLEEYQALFVLR